MDQQPLVSRDQFHEVWAGGGLIGVHDGLLGLGWGMGEMGTRDGSAEESSVTEQSGGSAGRRRRREMGASAAAQCSHKVVSTARGGNESIGCDAKRLKIEASKDNGESNAGGRTGKHNKPIEQKSQPSQAPKSDYIHVRARRGQATDSHSLAERARREKISERMKILQDLIPGCNKVIGKALVLDEIINYIQSLQRQVEFLSMKLEAIYSGLNSVGIEGFLGKTFGTQTLDVVPGPALISQSSRDYAPGPSSEWLHMQIGGSSERST